MITATLRVFTGLQLCHPLFTHPNAEAILLVVDRNAKTEAALFSRTGHVTLCTLLPQGENLSKFLEVRPQKACCINPRNIRLSVSCCKLPHFFVPCDWEKVTNFIGLFDFTVLNAFLSNLETLFVEFSKKVYFLLSKQMHNVCNFWATTD